MNTWIKLVLVACLFIAAAPSTAKAEVGGLFMQSVRLIDTGDSATVSSAATLVPKLSLDLSTVRADGGGLLPCALSCIVPGLGQLFNGQMMKGLVLLGAAVASSVLASVFAGVPVIAGVFGLVGVVIWAAAMADAYNGGSLIPNIGSAGDEPRHVIRTDDVQPAVRPVGASI